jgi:DNA-binding IscR family transcriptional regulator
MSKLQVRPWPDGPSRTGSKRAAIREAVHAFLEKLAEYTLEDLLRPKTKLRRLLGIN